VLKKGLVALFVAWFFYSWFVADTCSFDQEYAHSKVVKYLTGKSLPIDHLKFDSEYSGECKFAYMYEGAGEKIHFVIIDDFVHGVKLNMWDFNNQGD